MRQRKFRNDRLRIPGNSNAKTEIDKDLNASIAKIECELGNSSDISVNICDSAGNTGIKYASICISTLTDKKLISILTEQVSRVAESCGRNENDSPEACFNKLKCQLSGIRNINTGTDYDILTGLLLEGHTILLFDGCSSFFSADTCSIEGRSVEEPTSQSIIRGPKEAFTEKLYINIALIRKRLRNKALRVENLSLGYISNTRIAIMYIDGIAKNDIIAEIRRRLSVIDIDCILDSGYIEELIKDDRYSIFPTYLNSEKPDSVTAALLEGKIAILVDGTPYVLTAPAFFTEFLQASEDYYHNFIVSSVSRIVRFIALFLTLLVPAVFVSLVTFHQEMIPTSLLISIAAQREGIPFPALVEALIMEGTFEILREAGIRMPRVIGPAISIVGALVLGQAAVEAGIISSVMVIIVSITAISSFAIPNYAMSNAVRMLRFCLMFLAGAFGLYGVFMGLITITLHLCKIKSIGLPYLTPFAPKIKGGNKDTILRTPLWNMSFRPVSTSDDNKPRTSSENPVKQQQKGEPEFR